MGSTYYNKCGSCSHLNPNDKASGGYKYWCSYQRAYYPLDDSVCSHYDYDKSRDFDELYRQDNPSGCYITTIMCDILKYSDNDPRLNVLRRFRDEVLQKDKKYANILWEYDVIGPMIAKSLKEEKEEVAREICLNLYHKYLTYMITYIETNNYDKAVLKYTEMVNLLKNTYGLNNIDINSLNKNEYDFSKGGHGHI